MPSTVSHPCNRLLADVTSLGEGDPFLKIGRLKGEILWADIDTKFRDSRFNPKRFPFLGGDGFEPHLELSFIDPCMKGTRTWEIELCCTNMRGKMIRGS